MIRRAFVPAEGKVFLAADYSQIDLRVLAHFSRDEALCKAFRSGEDIHRATAAEVFGVGLKEVSEEQRRRAKAINFGIVYGQQAFGLSQSLGLSMAEAQGLIDRYFQRYHGVKSWIEETKRRAKADGFVRTLLGRTRYLPDLAAKNPSVRAFSERLAVNTPVQGTSADIIKVAMIRIFRAKLPARMLLQVHDDLLFEVAPGDLKEAAAQVRREMEHALELEVPLEVSVKTGKNWADMEALPRS
jgi:DNA polymerase-1